MIYYSLFIYSTVPLYRCIIFTISISQVLVIMIQLMRQVRCSFTIITLPLRGNPLHIVYDIPAERLHFTTTFIFTVMVRRIEDQRH
jgi:hypothetical protein